MLVRRTFLRLAAGALAVPACAHVATAQPFPSKPVRLVVGFAAGGTGEHHLRGVDVPLGDGALRVPRLQLHVRLRVARRRLVRERGVAEVMPGAERLGDLGPRQRRQEHAREDRDDRNHHQKFDQSKTSVLQPTPAADGFFGVGCGIYGAQQTKQTKRLA